MGGNVPGHHGVGITSGMQYNKGGAVQATYGVGNNAMKKTGPDGRQREAHYAGIVPFLKGLGNVAALGIPKLFNKQAMQYGYKGADAIKDYTLKNKKVLDKLKAMKLKAGASADDAAAAVQKQILKGSGAQAVGKTQRVLNYAAPSLYGAGIAGALGERAGIIDPERTKLEAAISDYAGVPLDYLSIPGQVYMGAQSALDEPGTDSEVETLSDFISGRDTKSSSTSDILDETVPGIVERISAEDQLRKDFESRKALYQELMGDSEEGQNNLGVLGRSLMEASETLNQGKGYISAGNVFGTSLADENARRAERTQSITDAASTQAITDVMSENAANSAVMNEMLMAGDIDGVRNMKGINQAQRAGIPLEKIPTDNGGELDKEALDERIGTVFIDPDNVIGKGFFVAVNSKGEKASFNDVQAAIEFAET